MIRGITYKLQERAYGGLSTATARKLEQAGADSLSRGSVTPAPPIYLRPGTRLVREWRGVTHMVLIHETRRPFATHTRGLASPVSTDALAG